MVSYSTPDGSNKMPEMLQEDVETFLGKIKLPAVSADTALHFRRFLFSVKPPFKQEEYTITISINQSVGIRKFRIVKKCYESKKL
jgi:hypothetical protein